MQDILEIKKSFFDEDKPALKAMAQCKTVEHAVSSKQLVVYCGVIVFLLMCFYMAWSNHKVETMRMQLEEVIRTQEQEVKLTGAAKSQAQRFIDQVEAIKRERNQRERQSASN